MLVIFQKPRSGIQASPLITAEKQMYVTIEMFSDFFRLTYIISFGMHIKLSPNMSGYQSSE